MPRIETLVLRSKDLTRQRKFYCDILGMTHFVDDTVGYGEKEARILFRKTVDSYTPKSNDLYWKIALAVPNIELACAQLKERGVEVGPPRQFENVGYLAHFSDPEDYTIELIEHSFQGYREHEDINPDLLGGGAHLNLITLRSSDIDSVIKTCHGWGMKTLSIQPVESHGFTLYFFAFTSDTPPDIDLHGVANREWLYRRKYTVLEVQHIHDKVDICQTQSTEAGYEGIVFSGLADSIESNELLVTAVD